MNKEDFPAWQMLMRLHISSISDAAINFVDNEYVKITIVPLTGQQLKEKQERNQAMLEIASPLSYIEFDDINECDSAK